MAKRRQRLGHYNAITTSHRKARRNNGLGVVFVRSLWFHLGTGERVSFTGWNEPVAATRTPNVPETWKRSSSFFRSGRLDQSPTSFHHISEDDVGDVWCSVALGGVESVISHEVIEDRTQFLGKRVAGLLVFLATGRFGHVRLSPGRCSSSLTRWQRRRKLSGHGPPSKLADVPLATLAHNRMGAVVERPLQLYIGSRWPASPSCRKGCVAGTSPV